MSQQAVSGALASQNNWRWFIIFLYDYPVLPKFLLKILANFANHIIFPQNRVLCHLLKHNFYYLSVTRHTLKRHH